MFPLQVLCRSAIIWVDWESRSASAWTIVTWRTVSLIMSTSVGRTDSFSCRYRISVSVYSISVWMRMSDAHEHDFMVTLFLDYCCRWIITLQWATLFLKPQTLNLIWSRPFSLERCLVSIFRPNYYWNDDWMFNKWRAKLNLNLIKSLLLNHSSRLHSFNRKWQ